MRGHVIIKKKKKKKGCAGSLVQAGTGSSGLVTPSNHEIVISLASICLDRLIDIQYILVTIKIYRDLVP